MRQYFLPHPHFEAAFYHHFLHDIGDDVRFVTYNGKSLIGRKSRHVMSSFGNVFLVCRKSAISIYFMLRGESLKECMIPID